jgi:flagellar motor switch protein FliN/FliY
MSELLTQDQLDQLLAAGGFSNGDDGTNSGSPSPAAPVKDVSSAALGKIFGIFAHEASSVLTTVLNKKVDAELRNCAKADFEALKNELGSAILCIAVPFKNGFSGEFYLCLKKNDVAVLADLMMMGEGNVQYSPEHDDAILELTNQINSSFALELSGEIGTQVAVSPSKMTTNTLDQPPLPPASLDMANITLSLEGRPDTVITVLVPQSLSDQIVEKNALTGTPGNVNAGGADFSQGSFGGTSNVDEGTLSLTPAPSKFGSHQKENIEMLLDVDLDVTIELGRSTLSIKRILELAPGSIVELDRMAGEPVDLRVNNKVVAKGEVVVIDESFGIRILSLISPEERIKSLV